MTDGSAHAGSVHQPGPWMPREAQRALTTPDCGLSSQRQTSATTTQLVTTGRKNAERKNADPRSFWLTSSARPRPPSVDQRQVAQR